MLFGYRPAEVDRTVERLETELGVTTEELRGREAQIGHLVAESADLRARLAERDREASALRSELLSARWRVDEELRSLTVIGRQLEELRVGARGMASRIRLQALREAAALSARTADAGALLPGGEQDRILDALEAAIDRVAGEWDDESSPAADAAGELRTGNGAAPAGEGATVPAASNGKGPHRARRLGRNSVSVDIGPFDDFSQLVRFEDAARAIGATGDISIKRFSEGRARIDVALTEPVDLLRELEGRCDLEFRVRSNKDDEIVLDVSDAS